MNFIGGRDSIIKDRGQKGLGEKNDAVI